MKLVYIGNNNTRQNWGCRSTSLALHQLLSINHTVIYSVPEYEAMWTFTPLPRHLFIPTKICKFIYTRRRKNYFKQAYKLLLLAGCQFDYLTENLEQNLNSFYNLALKYPHLKLWLSMIKDSEGIVINGEGSFIFGQKTRRDLLFYLLFISIAIKEKKKVFVLNAMFSPSPKESINLKLLKDSIKILNHSNLITTRDHESKKFLIENHCSSEIQFIPDALFSWKKYIVEGVIDPKFFLTYPERFETLNEYNFDIPFICLGGSSIAVASNDKKIVIRQYIKLGKELKKLEAKLYLVISCIGDSFLNEVGEAIDAPVIPVNTSVFLAIQILSKSKLFISGRYHPSIMASLGGTPCIYLGSNSHKTKSIQEVLRLKEIREFSSVPSDVEITEILISSKRILSQNAELRNQINSVTSDLEIETKKLITIL